MSFITVTVDWSVGIWNAHTPAVFLIGYALQSHIFIIRI